MEGNPFFARSVVSPTSDVPTSRGTSPTNVIPCCFCIQWAKCHVQPFNVESRPVHVVKTKHGRGICNGIRVGKHNFCIILCIYLDK